MEYVFEENNMVLVHALLRWGYGCDAMGQYLGVGGSLQHWIYLECVFFSRNYSGLGSGEGELH